MPKKAAAKALTKAQTVAELAARTGLSKSAVQDFLDRMSSLVADELGSGKPVTIPGLVKITVQNKPATAARAGRNPFTGAAITIKAKPARKAVKVKPLKQLKEMV